MTDNQKSKLKKTLMLIFFAVLNIGVIAATAMAEFGNSEDAAELSEVKINFWLLIPAMLCFLLGITAEIYKYIIMMKELAGDKPKLDNKNIRKVARRTVLLGKYYDNLTPAAVGGQPFQIYYMRKNSGLTKGTSISVPIVGMIAAQISFLILAIISFVLGGGAINNPVLLTTAWFGLIFYAFWPLLIASATFFPKPTTALIKSVVKFLAKIKIIKNREQALIKVEAEVQGYVKSVKMILKTRGLFLKTIILSLCFNFMITAIPFFVLTAFGGDMDFWACFATSIAVMSAVCFIPTPGNTGVAEGTFYVVFSALSTGYIFWAMLAWRFFSYYIYIIIGLAIFLRMQLENRKEKKRV